MRSRSTRALALGTALTTTMFLAPLPSQASPASGLTSLSVVAGTFSRPVDVTLGVGRHHHRLRADDSTQVITQSLRFAPGGSTGWVTHPGPEIITIMSGTLTFYQGVGSCKGVAYSAGSAVVQDGSVAHLARNEGATEVTTSVIFFGVPTGATPRIEAAVPAKCPS